MTEMQDPIEIYRAALAQIPLREEPAPPTIRRAEVWPYPDLRRLWARVETTPFAAYPNLAFTVTDPDGAVICTMFMVEIREPYQSVTLHLRQAPRPGERYTLTIELEREEQLLDTRVLPFELIFRDPEEGQ
ncbi:MAG: hypothetical protein ACUVS6_06290 [Anaerolineae bacterium]